MLPFGNVELYLYYWLLMVLRMKHLEINTGLYVINRKITLAILRSFTQCSSESRPLGFRLIRA